MRVLVLHNEYLQRGGEDTVVEQEVRLLESHGHKVELYKRSSAELSTAGLLDSVRNGAQTVWSSRAYREVRDLVIAEGFDVVHAHNTFPVISPSAYWGAESAGAAVVQTLHNYRLACANGMLFRDGHTCEECVGKPVAIPALLHNCYRGSKLATSAVVAMQTTHRALGTYGTKVHAYVALTDFAKRMMVRAGLPADRFHVKPNFISEKEEFGEATERQRAFIFAGRITAEKGVELLLSSWQNLGASGWKLIIIGDGPERNMLQERYRHLPGVEWRGWLSHNETLTEVAKSRYLVIPSLWYEGFNMTATEAFSLRTPVIAPDHAGFPEVFTDPAPGRLFAPGKVESLATTLRIAADLPLKSWHALSAAALTTYQRLFSPEPNYRQLMDIYRAAIAVKNQQSG